MKLVVFSTDRKIFEIDSPVRARMIEQALLVEEMHIVVYSTRSAYFQKEQVADNLFVYPTSSWSKLLYGFDAIRIGKRIINAKNDDCLVSAQDPFESGVSAFLLSRMTHTGLHIQLHTDPFSGFWKSLSLINHVRAFVAGVVLRHADGVRVVSERVARNVMSLGVDEQQIVKVPIFVDIGEFEHEPNGEEGESDSFPGYEKVIFSAGRLEPEKDFATLLRAFKKIRDVYAGALLIIVGSGREHGRLVRLAEWLGIDSNVRFLPWTHDIHPYYRKADVYVQSSLYEGWGMTIVEAMASGAPVVMTDVGCAGEIVLDGETGLIVPPSDATEMSEAILRMLGDNELRERIVEQAKLKVRELPSKEETAVLYKESWDRALKHFKKLRSYTPHI